MIYTLVSTLCLLLASLAYVPSALAVEAPPSISRISVDSSGTQGNGNSADPVISTNGFYIAFRSLAANLVAGDTNAMDDVFVHDLQTSETTRVSVDSSGNEGNGGSYYPAISADGRYVAFYSFATDLVAGDSNNAADIFVRDRQTNQTTRVSVDSSSIQGNGDSYDPVISADGRYVAFYSWATNLVPGDTNTTADIFVRDRQTNQTTRVSVDSGESEGNNYSYSPAISADGRYVAYYSSATNLVPGDTNAALDIFVRDRQAGVTTRASVDSSGNEGNSSSNSAAISADGRYVAFRSWASNLVPGDGNIALDIFVHDRQAGTTSLVSVGPSGNEGNGNSYDPAISADGRYIGFYSAATNLVFGDTNATEDMFVHDRQTNKTTRVSVDASGNQGNKSSYDPAVGPDGRYVAFPAISADGSYVAFYSSATNLVAGDTNNRWDIFIRAPQFNTFPWTMFLPAITGNR